MRNSNILKWAQNNKNNKLVNGKNKDDKGNKNWIHNPETLLNGHVVYLVKFLGDIEVDKPKGIDVVKQGIQKLKFNQQLKKSEGAKTPKAELTISVDGVTIQDPKTKKILHEYPLHRISYCADDKAEKRFFSFIAKDADTTRHTCFVFVSDKLAEDITLTIGQAFELAYKKFLDSRGKGLESKKQASVLQKRIEALEGENKELKRRLKDIANIKGGHDVANYLRENNITDLCTVEATSSASEPAEPSEKDAVKAAPNTNGSAAPADDELIRLDDADVSQNDFGMVVDKLDSFTLDDLNDDDFDPRAAEDKKSASPLTLAPPPALPPRDSHKNPVENNNNPFGTSNFNDDPFGMSSFSTPKPSSNSMPAKPAFSLEELDPLRN